MSNDEDLVGAPSLETGAIRGGHLNFSSKQSRAGVSSDLRRLQDSYITPPKIIRMVPEIVISYARFLGVDLYDLNIWDMFCGNSEFQKVFNEPEFQMIISKETDLFTRDPPVDMLRIPIEEFRGVHLGVGNIPFGIKIEVVERFWEINTATGTAFLFIGPANIKDTLRGERVLRDSDGNLPMYWNIVPPPSFLHNGRKMKVGPVCWYFIGFPREFRDVRVNTYDLRKGVMSSGEARAEEDTEDEEDEEDEIPNEV